MRNELAEFLRQQRILKLKVSFAQWGLLIAFLALWEIAARMNWIDPFIFSYPSKMWKLFVQMSTDGSLLHHSWITIGETVVGFLIGTVAGTLLAILIWWSPFVGRVLDPYIVVFNSMPKVALGPIFIVSFGAGFLSIVMMALAISVVITTIVVYTAFKEVDPNMIKMVSTFGASKRQVFQKVIFPAARPTILSTLKVNVGLAWVGVIVGEFLVAKSGLGYLMIYGFQVFNLTLVMMSLLLVSILATFMYQAVAMLEKRWQTWREQG
ncbi:ABC transporter permease [Effusibacillus lacus]|uniref:ABC transporter permease n=1 Tax=Effusibacillus lacus TaxID=1348429 RepID=A0A292YMG4_9BACL|nr:ABC transporter permease [Effusibacillus lacus]TCS70042.1 NitT/TauT family transport system permease protein [Effusibacillus lacus]GAX91118.1 ABC transporter permease [Effusibacillus lacus]